LISRSHARVVAQIGRHDEAAIASLLMLVAAALSRCRRRESPLGTAEAHDVAGWTFLSKDVPVTRVFRTDGSLNRLRRLFPV
jgi:hypothetical protein